MTVNINGMSVSNCLVDTGAFNSLIAKDVIDGLFKGKPPVLEKYKGRCFGANATPLPIVGTIETQVRTPGGNILTTLLVHHRDARIGHQLIIGMDILSFSTISFQGTVPQLTFSVPTAERDRVTKTKVMLNVDFLDSRITGTPRSVLTASKRRPIEPEHTNPSRSESNNGRPTMSTEGPARVIKVLLKKPTTLV